MHRLYWGRDINAALERWYLYIYVDACGDNMQVIR
jgi:hypothetical protein